MATDPILLWNAVALEANRVSHTNGRGEQIGPPLSARALAIVHLAMYDAFAGVAKDLANLPPYLTGLPAPGAAALDLAVAAAAHTTLSMLFPSQAPTFDLLLNAAGGMGNPSYTFGKAVGDAILLARAGDPDASGAYTPSPARGRHRVDPDDPGEGYHAPLYGAKAKGFAITKRHVLKAPPFNNGKAAAYKKALRQVRGKGIMPELEGTLPKGVAGIAPRTVDQTVIGIFWGYDGSRELGTPPRLYNQIVRRLAMARNNTPAENARLFALVNVAMADAGILAWEQKYFHDLWRPVLGIREHDNSMGPAAIQGANNISNDGDTQWLPLGAPNTNSTAPSTNTIGKNTTPNFPAYPSGHATFGAAALHMARLFYDASKVGDRADDNLFIDAKGATLDFVSDEFDGVNRDSRGTIRPRHVRVFPGGLWKMIEENGLSRVYLGVHWVFDAFAASGPHNDQPDFSQNVGGVPLGLNIAEDIFNGGRAAGLKKSSV